MKCEGDIKFFNSNNNIEKNSLEINKIVNDTLFIKWINLVNFDVDIQDMVEIIINNFDSINITNAGTSHFVTELNLFEGEICSVKTRISSLSNVMWECVIKELVNKYGTIQNPINNLFGNKMIANYLIPDDKKDVIHDGSCNIQTICKHQLIVHFYIAVKIVVDPRYLIELRGLTRFQFLKLFNEKEKKYFFNSNNKSLNNIGSHISIVRDQDKLHKKDKPQKSAQSLNILEIPENFNNFYHSLAIENIDNSSDKITRSPNEKMNCDDIQDEQLVLSIRDIYEDKLDLGEPIHYFANQMFKAILNDLPIPTKKHFQSLQSLQKIKGIGPKYAIEILRLGINNIKELSNYNPNSTKTDHNIPDRVLLKIIKKAKLLTLKTIQNKGRSNRQLNQYTKKKYRQQIQKKAMPYMFLGDELYKLLLYYNIFTNNYNFSKRNFHFELDKLFSNLKITANNKKYKMRLLPNIEKSARKYIENYPTNLSSNYLSDKFPNPHYKMNNKLNAHPIVAGRVYPIRVKSKDSILDIIIYSERKLITESIVHTGINHVKPVINAFQKNLYRSRLVPPLLIN